MPTIFREDGFKVIMYPNDHEPMHVHVEKAGSMIKIDALALKLMSVKGKVSNKDVNKAVKIVAENRALIAEKWRELRGKDERY